MRKTRFMSVLFLVWAVAFFLVPEFRQALQVPLLTGASSSTLGWLDRAASIDPGVRGRAIDAARQQNDAATLAFFALHGGSPAERMKLAGEAGALNPALTWVNFDLSLPQPGHQRMDEAAARLRAWDPGNAVPFLAEGTVRFQRRNLQQFVGASEASVAAIAQETEWLAAMEKAFAAPRYDSYADRRFELERTWLRGHGLDTPLRMLAFLASQPVVGMLSVRQYSNYLIYGRGQEAERAGRLPEAEAAYWKVAHFGDRMALQGASLFERLIGTALQRDAYQKLIPLLQKSGRTDEAMSLDDSLKRFLRDLDEVRGKNVVSLSTNYSWSALMVHLFAAMVVVFGAFTAICVLYVNAKRWVRPEKKGRLYGLLTVAENYASPMFFLACLGLYVSYYPYGRNFQHYMTAPGKALYLEPFFSNTFPNFDVAMGALSLPIGNPLVPYVWYALAGLTAVVVAASVFRRRRTPAAGAPASRTPASPPSSRGGTPTPAER